jgi:hypothetical protein
MKMPFITLIAVLASGAAMANQPGSDVEARLDALEVINVTAQKPARDENVAPDPELEAILDAAARAEAQPE